MSEPIITFITLTYNQLENATIPFLNSLYQYTPEDLFELIIVDNNSLDATRDYLTKFKEKKRNVKLVFNTENMGYSRGNNIGLRLVKTRYVGLLNNDILLSPNWLEKTMGVFEARSNVGMVSPQMLMQGYRDDNCLPAQRSNYLKKINRYSNFAKEDYTMKFAPQFSCVLFSKEVLGKVGYLDENFTPAFFEDVDYMARVWMNGFKCFICNKAFFFHNHCQTSSGLDNRNAIMERNREYLKQKNFMAWEIERLTVENSQLKHGIMKYYINKMKRKIRECVYGNAHRY